ncbi:hypothetical protein EJ04DRAFT_529167 [Polyplosphaeria fusca]|uniref:Uncharacterized protein n=1 Tax=Polyplosphaeria fusca TaxID=682080 RepID=A0A9P4QL88_9PLEO|nr:hypothetical protein EJ04DRAFT_529167 [Polyplosphaeria fusca]
MAATIASPAPIAGRPVQKDFANLQIHDQGRSTPLPQYEKTQSVPFALTLQEDKNNPGQFQLVVNIDSGNKRPSEGAQAPAASKKFYTNLQTFPSLGYDVSSLYHTKKSSPPSSPQQEKQEWSDLDAIPSDFLQKVVPDWQVTFERKDSTASTQSRKLADIKARIKKSGKGFVVRLLKGSNVDNNEVAEVHLGHSLAGEPVVQELDSEPRTAAELDATETEQGNTVFEIGTSSERGIERAVPSAVAPRLSSIPQWLSETSEDGLRRHSAVEDGFSDAETLTQEVRSIHDVTEDGTDVEPFSTYRSTLPTRASSIVKTPTRGLSVVGPVRRIVKADRSRAAISRSPLNRSDARKSFKRSPRGSQIDNILNSLRSPNIESEPRHRPRASSGSSSDDHDDTRPKLSDTRHHSGGSKKTPKSRTSAETLPSLRLRTDVPASKSANSSPVSRRRVSPRLAKHRSTSSVQFAREEERIPSPEWSEVDASDELREAIEAAFGSVPDELQHAPDPIALPVPRIEEPQSYENDDIGRISLPSTTEIRATPMNTRSPVLTFWGLALNALFEKAFDGLSAIRDRYGREPRVPPGHARSCGEALYDDFVERRPGAARLLEAYLNRPRAHTPTSPTGRTSTSSTISSVFDSASRASTLATPPSTYGGASSWGKMGESSKYSPTKLRSINPFSVIIGNQLEEQWLLTCANEGRYTPKIVHIDVNTAKIKSDKDLALALREHYNQLNSRWLNWAKLRGLSTIEFVQFEVHRNRFADIRASPSMPPVHSQSSEKAPSPHPYSFEPVDLFPPVGSTYLLHLFKHPSDYDGELITYLRSPKRRERLEFGLGWGINLVEGFLAQKVWMFLMLAFGFGSGVFAILWTIKKGDVQGAFGVAGWVVTLAGLVMGGLQAWLE